MNIQIGDSYYNRRGDIVKITSEDIPNGLCRIFIDSIGMSYFENGMYYYGDGDYSLTSEIPLRN